MYIGSLFDDRLNKNFRYSYLEKGWDKNYKPDLIFEYEKKH